jgi:hypothetical protein
MLIIFLIPLFFLLFYVFHSFTISAQSLQAKENNNTFPILRDPNLKVEQIVKGLFFPTSISFIDNNDFLVTQKKAQLVE